MVQIRAWGRERSTSQIHGLGNICHWSLTLATRPRSSLLPDPAQRLRVLLRYTLIRLNDRSERQHKNHPCYMVKFQVESNLNLCELLDRLCASAALLTYIIHVD